MTRSRSRRRLMPRALLRAALAAPHEAEVEAVDAERAGDARREPRDGDGALRNVEDGAATGADRVVMLRAVRIEAAAARERVERSDATGGDEGVEAVVDGGAREAGHVAAHALVERLGRRVRVVVGERREHGLARLRDAQARVE